jgi:starch-binding outer membrane protein, SusD/RagB family
MKKIVIAAFTLFIGSAFLSSCEDRLELQPQQSLSTDLAFADKRSSQGSLIGVYSAVQDLEVFGALPQVISDYQGDNVDFIGSFPTLQEIYQYNTLSDNSSIALIWRDHYVAILAANAVIENVPKVTDPTFAEAEKTQVIAEAKFLRAITYFQLVNLFAQPINIGGATAPGVPLVLDPFKGEVNFPARATVGEVHAQIKKDLEEAATGLPVTYATADLTRGRATRGAANGMLARLHLYRGEFAEAAAKAQQLIGSNVYSLANNYSFYNGLTPEDVFSVIMTAIDNSRTGTGGWASYYSPAEAGARGDAPFSDDLIKAYQKEPGDKRFALSRRGANGRLYTTKFADAVNNSDNAPVMRITEMYLTAAEALAELNGINPTSISLMNQLRTRAGLPVWTATTFATKAAFIAAILDERRKELAFEGHRRMDLLRKGLPLRPTGDVNASQAAAGQPKTILPIPQREVDLNKNLTQNKGY